MTRDVQELQDATDLIDELAARRLGVNRTDLRCLSRLTARGPLTASELAAAAGLTGGAATTAIDRLERTGLVERVRDTDDRRRVHVRLTLRGAQDVREIWGPIAEDAQAELLRFSLAELEVVETFLSRALAIQARHADRLRGGAEGAL
ncbi:MarR family transcriptional regulator [Herbidospora sp. NEAU-GS84]|uniref:MarR family transcriptional regulator n=1 Tax=Herbidospora solisilvae TaxID=2696284 RepID=A0A7C9N0N5_9ACTN|nr:MarR family transcriptional regulator [Herbidospora solisilvae]NAS25911.1 MarR family transcriptional regulator [Herbidospora solisilvae]